MWLVVAKVIDSRGSVQQIRVFNSERMETKIIGIDMALRLNGLIRNAGVGFNGGLVFSETAAKIPVINTAGQLLTSNSYFIVKIESNGIVHMVDSGGMFVSALINSVVGSIGTVANAWISDGYLTGYFESETPMARSVPFML